MITKNIIFLIVFVSINVSVFGQGEFPTLSLENSNYKVFYLSPSAPVSEENVIIDDVGQIRVELLSTSSILPSVVTPNGQIINQNTISTFNGEYVNYEISESSTSLLQTENSVKGFHYIFRFPTQGQGSYKIHLETLSGLNNDIAVAARIVTDSQVSVKLFTPESSLVLGKPVALTAAVFNGQQAISNASVVVSITSPSGVKSSITLIDNGNEADYQSGDGLYSSMYVPNEVGEYSVLGEINGNTANNVAFSRQTGTDFKVLPIRSKLTGTVADFPIQNPDDLRFLNGFVVKANTNTTIAGSYELVVYLKTASGKSIISSKPKELQQGLDNIEVVFEAQAIIEVAENGPFNIEKIDLVYHQIDGVVTMVDSLENIGQTQNYQLSQMSRPKISLSGVNTITPIDVNGNGLYEGLVFRIGVNVIDASHYEYSGTMFDLNRDEVGWGSGEGNLVEGINVISLRVGSKQILDHGVAGPYSLGNFAIWNSNASLIADNVSTTLPYQINQFEIEAIGFNGLNIAEGIDINSNGKYEVLRIKTGFYSPINDDYNIQLNLKDTAGNIIQTINTDKYINTGDSILQFDFYGSRILDAGINGPLTIGDVIVSANNTHIEVPVLFNTQPFNSNQFEPPLYFTGQNSAQGIDTNNNGKYEFLNVQSEVLTGDSDLYNIQASLMDSMGNILQTVNVVQYISEGTDTVQLNFDGAYILNAGINGPLKIGNVSITGEIGTTQVSELFTTQSFNSNDFDRLASKLDYISYKMIPLSGDGDSLLEPGETAQLLVKLSNKGSETLSGISASLNNISSNAEILNATSSYPTLNSLQEKENIIAFIIKLKENASRHEDIAVNITFDSTFILPKNVLLKVQTGLLGKIVYVNGVSGNGQIYEMNSDGTSKTNLSNSNSNDTNPSISPDGTKIAFIRSNSLFVMNADGSDQRLLDSAVVSESKVSWASDSIGIAYEKRITSSNRDIFVVNSNSGQTTALTDSSQTERSPVWIPNSNQLSFARGTNIFTINPDGTSETLLTTTQTTVFEITWSPDGKFIAWKGSYGDLYFREINTGINNQLDYAKDDSNIKWSPDSKNIAYIKREFFSNPRVDKLVFYNTDTNTFTEVVSNSSILTFDWSSNGKRLVFSSLEVVGNSENKECIRVINIDETGNMRLSDFSSLTNNTKETSPIWLPVDRIPPTSNASNTPSANSDGWNNSDTTIGISSIDNTYGSGLQNIKYNITGAQTAGDKIVNSNSANFSVFAEGVSTINFSAKDNAENVEPLKTFIVKIDKSFPKSQFTTSVNGSQTTFILSATDAVSGVSEIVYSVDGGALQTYAAPFTVSNNGGHSISYYAKDFAGNEETPRTIYLNAAQIAKSVLISEFRTRGNTGADDEFIELYNNGETAINIGGWIINTKLGSSTTPNTLATINAGIVIPAHGHYLLRKAGTTNYSLSGYAEADQTYTGSLGDNCGIALISTSSLIIDAVGFSSVTDSSYREGAGLAPSTGIVANGQYSFIRNFTKGGALIDSNNNRADFIFVATDGGTYNNLKAVVGSPGPENLNSPIYREGNVLISQIDNQVTLAESPNRIYDYTATSSQYPIGVLSVRRKLTNNTGGTINTLKIRITGITTKNSTVVASSQAVLRLINSSDITVTSLDGLRTFPLKGVNVETVPTTVDGGLNSSLTFNLGVNGLPNGESVNINLKSGIVTNGQYKLEFRVETKP